MLHSSVESLTVGGKVTTPTNLFFTYSSYTYENTGGTSIEEVASEESKGGGVYCALLSRGVKDGIYS